MTAVESLAAPLVRWWWLRGPFSEADIIRQLQAFADHGFGGVEIAWVHPVWLPGDASTTSPRPAWLSAKWQRLVGFAVAEGARIGLQVDLTFGSCWPFGGSAVTAEHAAKTLDGPSPHRLVHSWEEPLQPPVLDHLSRAAMRAYAATMSRVFAATGIGGTRAGSVHPGGPSAIFCDSLELDVDRIWTDGLDDAFTERYGYGLTPDALADPEVRYDHLALVGKAFMDGFVHPFVEVARDLGVQARMQCHGAPTDLLQAYAAVDIPESEALLFPPTHSRLAASAAALTGRPVVTCETFTCIYGFVTAGFLTPLSVWHQERIADLRLLADAVMANGVNRIVWHGAPYQPEGIATEFYASVHVGPDGALWGEPLRELNDYLTRACDLLQLGTPLQGGVGVLLGVEDGYQGGRIPDDERTPGATWRHELRHAVPPADLTGFHPLWVSGPFLGEAVLGEDGEIVVGSQQFGALIVEVEFLEEGVLADLVRLAEAGAAIQLRRSPKPPGTRRPPGYAMLVDRLRARAIDQIPLTPVVAAEDPPPWWARQVEESVVLFFAHPSAAKIAYPMTHGQAEEATREVRDLRLTAPGGRSANVRLIFEPRQSIAVRIDRAGNVEPLQVTTDGPAAGSA